ncbi:unnamed protein product, partial [Vitis vinifera]
MYFNKAQQQYQRP